MGWQVLSLLLTQHTGTTTLVVTIAQTLVMATHVEDKLEQLLAWVMFAAAAFVSLPVIAAITTNGYWFALYCFIGLVLGSFFITLMGIVLPFCFDSATLIGEGTNGMRAFDYQTRDQLRTAFENRSWYGKGCWYVTCFLPKQALRTQAEEFINTLYISIASIGIPALWILLGGSDAVSAAVRVFFVAIVPILGLQVFTAVWLAMGDMKNFKKAGPAMVLTFSIGFFLSIFASLTVPISILASSPGVGIAVAIPKAFDARNWETFAGCLISKAFKIETAAQLWFSWFVSLFT